MSEKEPIRGVFYWNPDTQRMETRKKKRKVETHAVITDEMPETESMATDGREHFTSRSKYYRHLKEHGYHVKEQGEDRIMPERKDPDAHYREIKEAAEKAYMDIKYDRIPIDEKEKQRCKEEERTYREWKRRNLL